MAEKAVSGDQPKSLAWAAYVAGHHLGFLRAWEDQVWRCRLLFEEGRIKLIEKVPEEVTELRDALDVLSRALAPASGRTLYRMEEGLAEWIECVREMVRDLSALHRPESEIDWASECPHGLKAWSKVYSSVSGVLKTLEHDNLWFQLGEQIAERHWDLSDRVQTKTAFELCESLCTLQLQGGYDFLDAVLQILKSRDLPKNLPVGASEIVDPELRAVTIARLHRHLCGRLAKATPLPLVIVRGDEVEFFGRLFRERDLQGAGWPILRHFCRNPRKDVTRETIIKVGRLTCTVESVAPHITRLRTKLRPAVAAFYAGHSLPDYAKASFIVEGAKPLTYTFEIQSQLIVTESSDTAAAKA